MALLVQVVTFGFGISLEEIKEFISTEWETVNYITIFSRRRID
jgi:hypothetical protein